MLERSSIVFWKMGRAGVRTPDAPLTKVAWIRGNDGWNRKYRVRPLGATRPSAFRFHHTLHPAARGPSPAVALSTESVCPTTSALDCIEDVCLGAPINLRTCGYLAAEMTLGH